MSNAECSTGIEYLDSLLGGLRIGDNVVWETDAGAYIDLFLEKFERHSLAAGYSLIYVSFNRSPMTVTKKLSSLPNCENITLLDCFTAGIGDSDPAFTRFYEAEGRQSAVNVIRVDNPLDVSEFTEILNGIEEEKGEGTRYIFDSMTGMQTLWGDEVKTYRFFTHACPRLYDLNTLAYWILEKEAHTSSFKANLSHVTQVVLEVSQTGGQLLVRITKAENRYSPNMFKPQKFEVLDDGIVFQEAAGKDILDLGGKVKALRLKRRLTQSQLAEKMNVTASYISQLERNLVSPSMDSLLMLVAELQTEPSYFFPSDKVGPPGYIYRKSQRQSIAIPGIEGNAMECRSLVNTVDNRRMQPMLVTIEPGNEFSGYFLNHKGDEFILILKGELEVDIEDETHVLREGDSIYLDSIIPTAWRSIGEMPVQAIWVLSPPII